MQAQQYNVAGFCFMVHVPEMWDIDELLPSFREFACDDVSDSIFLFDLFANDAPLPKPQSALEAVSTSVNDVGHVVLFRDATHYWAKMTYGNSTQYVHRWRGDHAFTHIDAQLCVDDKFIGLALTSILRIAYSQAILKHQGISIHASCVWKDESAYLFLGKSGTGKSTHSRLWMEHLPNVQLLNDDNPTLRIIEDKVWAYGTPWSGKTNCYKNLSFPVAGIVHLEQAKINHFAETEGIEGFSEVLPSCSAIRADKRLQHDLYETLLALVTMVKVGKLQCLPNAEAAMLCCSRLTANDNQCKN